MGLKAACQHLAELRVAVPTSLPEHPPAPGDLVLDCDQAMRSLDAQATQPRAVGHVSSAFFSPAWPSVTTSNGAGSPRCCSLASRLLASVGDAERRQHRDHHHAAGEPYAQMKPVQKHDPVPFVGQGPLLPHRELILHPRHHARHGALRQVRLAQQRPESPADAAAIDAAKIAAQQRLIHLSGPSRIARQDGAPKLGRRPILVAQASPRHRNGPRPVASGHRPLDRAVTISAPPRYTLMRGGPQCREELFLEDGLDGPTHAITKLGLEILAKLQNGRKGCATVRHGVILRRRDQRRTAV